MKKGIVLGIVFLFVVMSFTSISGIQLNENIIIPSDKGNTLYVGGSGEGNYTRIQDAIDNASDGDTVFVYDDSSPYYENIRIDKHITLIGEDRNTTIINGENWCTVRISPDADNVLISGFTITGASDGIFVNADNNIIQGNKIVFNYFGIEIGYDADYNIIINNIIAHNRAAGILDGGRDSGSTVTWNIIGGNAKEFPWWGGLYIHHSGGYYHHNDFHLNWGNNAFVDGPWGSTWDDGSEGNYWDDYEYNPGYPDVYIIPGSWEDGIDRYPSPTPFINYPIVCISSSYYAEVNEPIKFYPVINADPSSVSWYWEFGDGTTSNEKYPVHSYFKPGIFHINVTVTDNQGISDTDKGEAYIGVPPNTPTITGPTTGRPRVWYEYTIVATDPDGGNLYYEIIWGEGAYDYIGPYPAGEEVNVSHRWHARGTFTISVKAVDEAGFESDWGELVVTMPRNRATTSSLLMRFLERFPLLERLLYLI